MNNQQKNRQQGRTAPLTSWLLKWASRHEDMAGLEHDMTEVRQQLREQNGALKAGLWFWNELIKCIPQALYLALEWRTVMIKNYFLIALRNSFRRKWLAAMNLLGLSVGLAAFLMIFLYVQHELSYDRQHENSARIFRVVRDNPGSNGAMTKTAVTPAPLAPTLREAFPEVADTFRLIKQDEVHFKQGAHQFVEHGVFWADPSVMDVLSLPVVHGSPESMKRNAICLSESMAEKYFGRSDVTGETLRLEGQMDFEVAAVYKDMNPASHFIMDAFIPYETFFEVSGRDVNSWQGNYSYTYILLRDSESAPALQAKLPAFADEYVYDAFNLDIPDEMKNRLVLQPLTSIHLHSQRNEELAANGNASYVLFFASVAALLLVIACINYINMTLAQSAQRAREVGIRKVSGAQKGQMVGQFVGESMMMSFMGLMLAVFWVVFFLPGFCTVVQSRLSFNPLTNGPLALVLLSVLLLVGLGTGLYPAFKLASYKPIAVLKGRFSQTRSGKGLRNALVLTQFVITLFFIVVTLVVRDQMRFIQNKDMGYATEQIVTLKVRDQVMRQNMAAVKTELVKHEHVNHVTTAYRLPNNIDEHMTADWPGRPQDRQFPIYYNTADYDYINVFDIPLAAGRNFSDEFVSDGQGAFLVNESAVRAAGWPEPVGQMLCTWTNENRPIVGVMKDFHMHSLHRPIEPVYIFLTEDVYDYLAIKVDSEDLPATLGFIRETLKKVSPSYPVELSFFDEVFQQAYQTEQRMMTVFSAFSVLAIVVACVGLLALSTHTAQQRTKEIGIRKVMGASESRLFGLLSAEFLKWVVMAAVFAFPLSWWVAKEWLQSFAYRAPLSVVSFVLALALILAVAFLTVGMQAMRASRSNPVVSLKYE